MSMGTLSVTSIGQLIPALGRTFEEIEHATKALGITPRMRVDGIAHFSDPQVVKLRQYFNQQPHRTPRQRRQTERV